MTYIPSIKIWQHRFERRHYRIYKSNIPDNCSVKIDLSAFQDSFPRTSVVFIFSLSTKYQRIWQTWNAIELEKGSVTSKTCIAQSKLSDFILHWTAYEKTTASKRRVLCKKGFSRVIIYVFYFFEPVVLVFNVDLSGQLAFSAIRQWYFVEEQTKQLDAIRRQILFFTVILQIRQSNEVMLICR